VSKKKLPPKPEGYDEVLGDLVDLIRQHQSKAGGKAKPTPVGTKKPATKKHPAKKRKGGQP
jgi:hypothetical protein